MKRNKLISLMLASVFTPFRYNVIKFNPNIRKFFYFHNKASYKVIIQKQERILSVRCVHQLIITENAIMFTYDFLICISYVHTVCCYNRRNNCICLEPLKLSLMNNPSEPKQVVDQKLTENFSFIFVKIYNIFIKCQ